MKGKIISRKCVDCQPCNLKLEGADNVTTGLTGEVDGIYEVWSCNNGLPMYKRANSLQNGKLFTPQYTKRQL